MMPIQPSSSSSTLCAHSEELDMYTFDRLHGPNGLYEHALEPQSDDEGTKKLKDLFEDPARTTTAGRRDTIDSILSKYDTVLDKVQQDLRIDLALTAELSSIVVQDPASNATDVRPALRSSKTLGNHVAVNNSDHQRLEHEPTYDPMLEYLRHLQHSAVDVSDEEHGGIAGEDSSVTDHFRNHDVDDTDISWDSQEDTLLDVYADLGDDVFETEEVSLLVKKVAEVPTPKSTEAPDNCKRNWLPGATRLGLSPVVQVAMVEPAMSTYVVENEVGTPLTFSDDGLDKRGDAFDPEAVFIPPITPAQPDGSSAADEAIENNLRTTESGDAVHSEPTSQATADLREMQRRLDALVADYTTDPLHSIPVDGDLNDQDDGSQWLTIASNVEGSAPPQVISRVDRYASRSTIQDWANQVQRADIKEQKLPQGTKDLSAFLTSLAEDETSEHVLNAGVGCMLLAIALAERLFW